MFLSVLLISSVSLKTAYAQSHYLSDFTNGANACMPRLFGNLGDYLSSNGSLKNNTTKLRNVVCAVPTPADYDYIFDDIENMYMQIAFDNVTEDFDCTFQVRDVTDGNTVVDSVTFTVAAGFSGRRQVSLSGITNVVYNNSTFVQCKLSPGARVLMVGNLLEYDDI